jgi:Tol biopolymer transport system component
MKNYIKEIVIGTMPLCLFILGIKCSSEERSYEKAKAENTVSAYENFINKYPDNPLVSEAKIKLDSLRYANAIKENTNEALTEFLNKHPNSKYLEEVKDRIRAIKGQIIFTSKREGNEDIFVIDSDGSNLKNLTKNSASDYFPLWSPDGRHIAFISDRTGDRKIYTMKYDGSEQKKLTKDIVNPDYLAWSPDSRHIVFTSDHTGKKHAYIINNDGSSQKQITKESLDPCHLQWSPDGKCIVFSGKNSNGSDIYLIDIENSAQINLTNDSKSDITPAWSPDGRIVFASERDGNLNIYIMDKNGENVTLLTNDSNFSWAPSYSPDGKHIAFIASIPKDPKKADIWVITVRGEIYIGGPSIFDIETPKNKLMVMNADGTNKKTIVNDRFDCLSPQWLKDGLHILYVSEASANNELYMININSLSLTDISKSKIYGHSPCSYPVLFQ